MDVGSFSPLRASAASNSRTWSGAPSRISHCQTGSNAVRRICPGRGGKLLSTKNGSSGRNSSRAGSSVRGRASSSGSVPRTILRSCSSTKVATAVFAALDGALELPHQQRLRLRRKLREISLAARSMSGSCARNARFSVSRGRRNASTAYHKSAGVKKSFRKRCRRPTGAPFRSELRVCEDRTRCRPHPRQHQFRPQSADRRVAECETAAIQRRQVDHDRQPQPGSRLGLVQPLAAARDLGALGGRQPAAVVVDDDPQAGPAPGSTGGCTSTSMNTRDAAHLQALSTRLPAISSRS